MVSEQPDSPAPALQSLTAGQRALLRLACWVAMADGDFAEEERRLLEKLVAGILPAVGGSAALAGEAVHGLAAEALQPADLQALVADLGDADGRQLAVKLAFQMACINQRPQDAGLINIAERRAYRQLLELLQLPDAAVEQAEWAGRQELQQQRSLREVLGAVLAGFGAWPTLEGQSGDLPPGYWL